MVRTVSACTGAGKGRRMGPNRHAPKSLFSVGGNVRAGDALGLSVRMVITQGFVKETNVNTPSTGPGSCWCSLEAGG